MDGETQNLREAHERAFQCHKHCIHHLHLPVPSVGLERLALAAGIRSLVREHTNLTFAYKGLLHVHGNAALPDNNWDFSKRLVPRLDDIPYLQREVVSRTLLTPVERLEWEHALQTRSLSRDTHEGQIHDRPWTVPAR